MSVFLLTVGISFGQTNDLKILPSKAPKPAHEVYFGKASSISTKLPTHYDGPPLYFEDYKVYDVFQVQPKFPGDFYAWKAYNKANLIYPKLAKANKSRGFVLVRLIFEKDGSVSYAQVIKDQVKYGASEEVIKFVKNMPKWTPARNNGKVVRVLIIMSFYFK